MVSNKFVAGCISLGLLSTPLTLGSPGAEIPPTYRVSLESRIASNPLNLHDRYQFSESDYIRFQNWIDATRQESKQNKKYAVIVDKAAYTLTLIKDGEPVRECIIRLGPNPIDPKIRENDMCTPEGLYKAVQKKGPGSTSYHKAILINYPNSHDTRRFNDNLKEGLIPSNSRIGGLIEIHGNPNGSTDELPSYNWTLGCISLSNADISSVFSNIQVGDRITIVRYGTKEKY